MRHGLPRLSIRYAPERKSLLLSQPARGERGDLRAHPLTDADASRSYKLTFICDISRPEARRDSPFDSRGRVACKSSYKRPRMINPRAFDTEASQERSGIFEQCLLGEMLSRPPLHMLRHNHYDLRFHKISSESQMIKYFFAKDASANIRRSFLYSKKKISLLHTTSSTFNPMLRKGVTDWTGVKVCSANLIYIFETALPSIG